MQLNKCFCTQALKERIEKIQNGSPCPRIFYDLGDSSNANKAEIFHAFCNLSFLGSLEISSSVLLPSPHRVMQVGHSNPVQK